MSISKTGKDYGLACVRSVQAGRDATRRRGEISVQQDNMTYFYHRKYRGSVSDFKSWVHEAFARNDRDIKVTGQYPTYSIE